MRDVTANREQEEQLRRSLAEKETLVREIHHRVKNNIQVIVSLLSLQSNHTNDPHVLSAFEEAESRLRAIAHIHERLYASDDLTEVEFASYLTGLARELIQLHSSGPNHIALDLDVADMVLHIEQAIPLGLVANELMLNSLKHGLRGNPGQLTVKLSYIPGAGETLDSGFGRLIVADSGRGLPDGFDPATHASLGLRLVTMLVRQLHGGLEFITGPGTTFTVTFPIEFTSTSSRNGE
jgi:two-component sensor histidine kinase